MRISDWSSDVCSSDLFNEGGEAFVVFEYRFGCFAKVWVYAKRRQGGGLGGGAIASHLRCRLHPAVRDCKCGCSYGCGRSRAVGRGTPTCGVVGLGGVCWGMGLPGRRSRPSALLRGPGWWCRGRRPWSCCGV